VNTIRANLPIATFAEFASSFSSISIVRFETQLQNQSIVSIFVVFVNFNLIFACQACLKKLVNSGLLIVGEKSSLSVATLLGSKVPEIRKN
jgi:hypothetical protein